MSCTPAALAAVLTEVSEAEPDARLDRNAVGNLLVVVDGVAIAYVDLMGPGWYRFDEETAE